MYLLIIALPLLGTLISGFGGRWLGCYGSAILATLCVISSATFSLLAFYEIGFGNSFCYVTLASWMESGTFFVNWGFLFDSLTVVMLIVVTIVSSLVHVYSIKYMEDDPHLPRFVAYLEIFTFFMLVLVTSDNLIQMFLGWEGVGLASYLLINFWHTRLSANQSAIKALVVNRVGDFGLSLGILVLFHTFRSVEYNVIFSCAPLLSCSYTNFLGIKVHTLTLISIFLFIGAVGKSAQLGLHTWLPDAMEGPTPVSALIHAATMVTAGVFLMVRFSPLLEYSPFILFALTVFGAITAFFAALTGTFQNDLKKVIAYSTCSQLGYMIFACGLSCYHVSMFHLANHAFFKALLFLSAGSVIHAVSDEQDMRRMGSLMKFLPSTYSLMLIGSLALTGFPFLTGFYSKDFILELSQVSIYSNLNISYGYFACWLGNTAAFFTSFYSFRLIFLTFINNANTNRLVSRKIHESSALMLIPLIFLALGSIFVGYLTKDIFIGAGTSFWGNSIFILPNNSNLIEVEGLSLLIKWLPFLTTVNGLVCSLLLNIFGQNLINFYYIKAVSLLAFVASKKWYWDKMYNTFLVKPLMNFGYTISFKNLDRGFIELSGPYGLPTLIKLWSSLVLEIQTGQITHYIFFVVLGSFLFLLSPILVFDNLLFRNVLSICLISLLFF